ncbi:MAG: PKD domain-containing protein [Phycisphaerae bacterium]
MSLSAMNGNRIRPSRGALVTILAALAVPVLSHGELPSVGVNAGAPVWDGSILFTDALAADIAGSGCRAVRINFRIDGNPSWTPEHLARYDTIIQTARNHDLAVLGIIAYEAVTGGQADWNENYDTTGLNDYIVNFAQTAYMLMDRYKDEIKLFEIWNEPDCWSVPPDSNPLEPGCFYIWPRNYANLLAETYKECIEQGGAEFFSANGLSLGTGGLFGHDIGGSFSASMIDYMNIVYQQEDVWDAFEAVAGRRYPWDYFGYHFYLNQGEAVSISELAAYFDHVRFWKAWFDDTTEILVTEFGWNTQAVSEQLQAENLRDSYDWLRTQADIITSYWYQWNDGDGGWGLVYSIGNPKPSYFEFAAQCGTEPLGANFYAYPLSGPAPLEVQFTNTCFGVIDTYLWDFGDDDTSDEADPLHQYVDPGTYTVSLTITGPGGEDTETKVDYITVTEPINPADLDGDGDADLADFARFARCYTGAGATVPPPGCECGLEPVAPVQNWESAGSLGDLSASIADNDLLHGMMGVVEAGGFYPDVPGGETGGLIDLTDGIAGGPLEAVLADYSRPSLQVRYEFSSPQNIGNIRVFAANGDGRVFQNYDVEYSVVGESSFQTLTENVTTGPFGQVNNGGFGATLTTISGAQPGAIASDVDALRFIFYDVSTVSPPNVFWDEWDTDEPDDTDGNPRAYVASIIKEIDVFAAESRNIADLDDDGDADMDDFSIFATHLAGPQQ